MTRFDVAEVIRDVVGTVEPLARQGSLVLTAEVQPDLSPLTADQPKVRQILFNLLSNAIKFTPPGGCVTITAAAEVDPEDGHGPLLCLRVADTGIGIKPEDQERIFQMFEQGDGSYGKEHRGTGLGLAVTRKLVELHGGRIWVESPGVSRKGSTFTVLLPLEPGARAAAAPA